MNPRRKAENRRQVIPRVKVWLEMEDRYVFGFGLSEILKAVQATGSIKGAAEKLGKSYRYVWGRVKEAERTMGQHFVETRVGGQGTSRSALTESAARLVAEYDALRQRMLSIVEEEFASRFSLPAADKASRS